MNRTSSVSSSSSSLIEEFKPIYGSINTSDLSEDNRLGSAVPFLPYRRKNDPAGLLWTTLTWSMFFILGVGTLLPWNLFITANDYFIRKSCMKDFEAYLVIVAQFPNFLFFFLTIFIKEFLTASYRIYISLGVMLTLFIVTIVLAEIEMNSVIFAVITFTCIAVINAVSGLYQSSVLGVTGVFPSIHVQAVLVGQGIGGILPAVILVLSIFTVLETGVPSDSPDYLNTSACIYFVCATLCIALCITAYFSLTKIPFSRNHLKELPSPRKLSFISKLPREFKQVIRYIWIDCFTVFFVFFITLSLFPAITSLVVPRNKFDSNSTYSHRDNCYCPGDNGIQNKSNYSRGNCPWDNGTYTLSNASNLTADLPPCSDWTCLYFTPIFCFFAFNLSDSIGRGIAGFTARCKVSSPLLALASLFRVVFLPLFLLCNIPDKRVLPFWLQYDEVFLTLILTLGLSNGVVSSISMMHGPRKAKSHHGETATILMALFLGLGLLLGSCFSFLLEKIFVH